jgi:RHS repeat-associated protein
MGKKPSILSAGIALACAACLPVVGAIAAITGIAAKVLGAIPSAGIGFLDKIKLLAKAIYGKMVIGAKALKSKLGALLSMFGGKPFLDWLGVNIKGLLGLNLNCNQYGGDPVNMATGNFVYEKEYLKIKGLFPLSFRIFYNAQEKRMNALGYGWVHGFEASAAKEGHVVTVFLEDGKQEEFIGGHNGCYVHSQGLNSALSEQDGQLIYENQEGIKYVFNDNGRLIRKENKNSNFIELSYDGQGKLIRAANNSDSSFEFSYDGNRLKQVTDNTGRTVNLKYQRDMLTCVSDENNGRYQFAYDKQNKLIKILNPLDINILNNEYDESFRMKKQEFPDGGVISYEYKDDEKKLILTEQNGNEITYIRDDKFRSVATVYADGEETYAYNAQNQRTLYTDKKGNTTKFSYDNRSNLVKITNPLGETINTDYNDLNKPVRVKLCGDVIQQTSYDDHGNATGVKDALDRESKIEYNSDGQPIKIIQPDGSEISIEYDMRGNILTVTEPNAVTAYEYDELNRVIATIDGNGNKTGYEYNTKGDITKVVNALGEEQKYEYNTIGKVTKIVDFNGSEFSREYNCLGKVSRVIDQEGNETKLEYDLMWKIIKQIDANGNTTIFDYDALHHLVNITNTLGHGIHYVYDPNGNKTEITDSRGEQVHFLYDALNRVEKVIEANGATTSVSYNHMGQITRIINALGQESSFTYDKAGQKIEETDPSGRKTKYSYNQLGQIQEVIDPAGRKTTYEYLPGGLLERIAFPDGTSTVYTYDKNKNTLSKTSQDGYVLYYEYDCLNRITKISSNNGQDKLFTYDAMGNVNTMTDANGNTTKYIYSPSGKLLAVVDPLGHKTKYDYDKLGNLIEVKQLAELGEARKINNQNSDLRVTKYVRDELGRVEKIIDALGNTETYTYDEAGNVIAKLDRDGYLTKYDYDPTNQLTEVIYADGKSVKLSYNPLKQLTEIKDWLGITNIEVDELGRARKVTDHSGKKVEYNFGAAGEKTSINFPDGKIVSYEYDELLRLKALINDDNHIEYIYDEQSRLRYKMFSNGVKTKYSYNDMGLLFELAHSDKDGMLDRYVYTYDNMLNKISIEKYRRGLAEESGQYQYTYDALSRLTDVAKDDKPIKTYGYDEFGNRSFMLDKGIRTDYTYNQLNQLLHLRNVKQNQDFTYDARGNLTQILEKGRLKNIYEFSPLNRMTKVINDNGQTADYKYNGLGQRVGMIITDLNSMRIANRLNPVKNISYVLDLTKQYHNLLQKSEDEQIKNYIWDQNVVAESDSGESNFYLQDELGSPLRFTGTDGTLMDSYAYDEFGNDPIGNQGVMQPFGFTGYRFDSVAQIYFAQAREYMPETGRFAAKDTHWNPNNMIYVDNNDLVPDTNAIRQSANLYVYCLNNPILFTDPLGLDSYIFYLPEWKNEALDDQKRLMQQYSIPKDEIHLIELNKKSDLTDGWNNMGTNSAGDSVPIDTVIINTHADPTALAGFGNFDSSDIAALDNQNVGSLILYGCNAGHLDYNNTNPASQFAQKVNYATVLASDGTVYSNWNIFGLIAMKYTPKNDSHFKDWRNKADPTSTRGHEGWVAYQYVDGQIITTTELGYGLKLKQMLEALSGIRKVLPYFENINGWGGFYIC